VHVQTCLLCGSLNSLGDSNCVQGVNGPICMCMLHVHEVCSCYSEQIRFFYGKHLLGMPFSFHQYFLGVVKLILSKLIVVLCICQCRGGAIEFVR